MAILITGSAGFIGSHLTEKFVNDKPQVEIIALDKLTYAGNLENLSEVNSKDNFRFIHGDICNQVLLDKIFDENYIDAIFHLAAESHVDNSIKNPNTFIQTNVNGTVSLLEAARKNLDKSNPVFYHISTDEVFGTLGKTDKSFNEKNPYKPNSPYSASKASSDHFVRAYGETYGLDYIITNCSNNFGPKQHDEKLIPVVLKSILQKKQIPVYGNGSNIRDWLYVKDHIQALYKIHKSKILNETFCIGGGVELDNLTLVKILCEETDKLLGKKSQSKELITFVKDRAGHDFRYSIDNSKLMGSINWSPNEDFIDLIIETISYYLKKYKK